MQLTTMILSQLWKHKLWTVLFLLALVLEVAYAVAAPYSLKFIMDEALIPRNMEVFLLILGILLIGGTISVLANLLGDYSLGILSGNTIRTLRAKLFSHLQKQSLPFFQQYRIGDLTTRFSSDMSSIEGLVRLTSPSLLKESFSVILGLTALFLLEWRLALALLAASLLMMIAPKLMQKRAEAATIAYRDAQADFSNTIDEMIKGHRTIKGLHQQARFAARGGSNIKGLFTLGFRLHMTSSLMERIPLAIMLLTNGGLIGLGGYLIFREMMSIGDFMAFFTLSLTVAQGGANLSYLIPDFIDSGVSFRRVSEVLEVEPTVPEADNAITLPQEVGTFRLNQVTFGYSDTTTQLRNVSLAIPSGSYVAFVGSSGSGKSTALQLLARFYDPREGAVTADNLDLRTISEVSLRRYVTLVTQETFLFNTTIRDNLVLDQSGLTDEELRVAAEKARIHAVIERWPDGYDTKVHHEGGTLSGGERQRLAIARALLRKPRLLLLDEVTSALDPATEADINKLLLELRGDHTLVSVTHRLDSAAQADLIFVFDQGVVVESGSHPELMERGGVYRGLWDKQHGFRLSEDGRHAAVQGERLSKLAFFSGLESDALEEIAAHFATETFKAGDDVVTEGEEGDKFYIIVRGRFEVRKEIEGQGEITVAVLQDGDHFGEIALLRDIPRTATVRASASGTVLSMNRESFLGITARYPRIRSVLEQSLLERS
ncbi:ABC transporter transmembrane domain-containing protein [Paenibacillus agaridevorans]|uniref:ABC transporter transmembrane domain-containing protein n=1 Tax=Paenibacillus agaridevorans TaxID=171404 RepID=UPI001BE46A92|nr:ABC transporter transmembrane domain-containing protein [Paenibacillus agaridevorans]